MPAYDETEIKAIELDPIVRKCLDQFGKACWGRGIISKPYKIISGTSYLSGKVAKVPGNWEIHHKAGVPSDKDPEGLGMIIVLDHETADELIIVSHDGNTHLSCSADEESLTVALNQIHEKWARSPRKFRVKQDQRKILLLATAASVFLYFFLETWLEGLWELVVPIIIFFTIRTREWKASAYIFIGSLMFGLAKSLPAFSMFWSIVTAITWPLSWPVPLYILSSGWVGQDWATALAITMPICVIIFLSGRVTKQDIGVTIGSILYVAISGVVFGWLRADEAPIIWAIASAVLWPIAVIGFILSTISEWYNALKGSF